MAASSSRWRRRQIHHIVDGVMSMPGMESVGQKVICEKHCDPDTAQPNSLTSLQLNALPPKPRYSWFPRSRRPALNVWTGGRRRSPVRRLNTLLPFQGIKRR
jgi:hypothetical protein